MYPTQLGPATARVTATPQGAVKVHTAAHDIGTGAYTMIALSAADRLGVALDKITVELGNSELPPASVAGGPNTTASVCNVVAKACEQIRAWIGKAAVEAPGGLFAGKARLTSCWPASYSRLLPAPARSGARGLSAPLPMVASSD